MSATRRNGLKTALCGTVRCEIESDRQSRWRCTTANTLTEEPWSEVVADLVTIAFVSVATVVTFNARQRSVVSSFDPSAAHVQFARVGAVSGTPVAVVQFSHDA